MPDAAAPRAVAAPSPAPRHPLLHPIGFSIPEAKIVGELPAKTQVLATVIPGDPSTYVFDREADYGADYQRSLFGMTMKKAGWDCLRHLEILANGCIPYFRDFDACPPDTLTHLPKDLIREGNRLFDQTAASGDVPLQACLALIAQLLAHTRRELTTVAMAKYVLATAGLASASRILFLSGDSPLALSPDYLRCLTLHGFKTLLGRNCHDHPRVPHLYRDFPAARPLYGKGFTYARGLDSGIHDERADTSIEADLRAGRYDAVVYGSYHRGMPLLDRVRAHLPPERIVLLCGEDLHVCDHAVHTACGHHVFVREL